MTIPNVIDVSSYVWVYMDKNCDQDVIYDMCDLYSRIKVKHIAK